MIIALAGASGSGKTTLAKKIAKDMGWVFQENSAGLITTQIDKQYMKDSWGYAGDWGQKRVINFSHDNPQFGLYFQRSILAGREELFEKNKNYNCIYDRSPLDPIVFYLNQCVHNYDEQVAEQLFAKCTKALKLVDIIIKVPLHNPAQEIEDNGSRVANWYFQKKVDRLFDLALDIVQVNIAQLGMNHLIRCYKLDQWDFDHRVKSVKHIIESNKELVLR